LSEVAEVVGIAVLVAVLVFVVCMIGTVVGAFTGWVIHITPLRGIVEAGFNAFRVNASGQLVNIGGAVGFVGGLLGGAMISRNSNK